MRQDATHAMVVATAAILGRRQPFTVTRAKAYYYVLCPSYICSCYHYGYIYVETEASTCRFICTDSMNDHRIAIHTVLASCAVVKNQTISAGIIAVAVAVGVAVAKEVNPSLTLWHAQSWPSAIQHCAAHILELRKALQNLI